ncbi:MAG: hypothetical protein FJ295_10980 [Planctomycetes bacterium]|nr:hypothetical protein [Planctomycetota bacterium]
MHSWPQSTLPLVGIVVGLMTVHAFAADPPVDIGARRELFVDRFLIDFMTNARLELAHPERREVVFEANAAWESGTFFVYSVVQEGSKIRLYYRATFSDGDENIITGALAESTDGGRSFSRPNLGLYEFKGSKKNNIIWQGSDLRFAAAFLDTNPDCPPEARFKGLSGNAQKLYALASADGLRWHAMQDQPVTTRGDFDTINTAFWDAQHGCYRSYTRVNDPTIAGFKPTPTSGAGIRVIQMSTSKDFIHWTPPVPLQYDDGDVAMQMYENNIVPCSGAEHVLLGFPNRYVLDRNKVPQNFPFCGINDALFMASRDGVHWSRYREAWVRPGLDQRNWTQRNNYPAWHIIQTSPEEWSILISEHYMQKDGAPVRLRRLSIRPWGFVSVHVGYEGGEMGTKPIVFSGKSLRLNYSTSVAGSIQVEVQDENGQAIPGFGLNEMTPLFGDELDAAIKWGDSGDLSRLIGRPVRLRFVLKDADLFSLRFAD